MTTTIFPYTAWVLMPSFRPAEVTFVKTRFGEWHATESGKSYHPSEIHQTKAAAIAWGLADLAKQQAAIDKMQKNLDKRRAVLKKASEGQHMKIGITKIYYGGGRRWLTLKAACNAEAKARLKERARRRNGYYSNDDWNPRLVARFAQALERQHRRTTP